jgi:hypothetical protein
MEVVIGRCVEHEESHTWALGCPCTWSSFYFWRLFFKGAHVEGFFLLFFDILGGCTCGDISCYSWIYIYIYYFMEFWHDQILIRPYLLGFALWRWSTCYFGVLTTSFLVECSLHIHPWSWLPWNLHMWSACMHAHSWRVHSMWTLGI